MTDEPVAATLATAVRDERGRCVATLVRLLGDIDEAEDSFQEAASRALATWPRDGVPDRPGAWLTTVARNAALDRRRRQRCGELLERDAAALLRGDRTAHPADPADRLQEVTPEADDQLRLLFTCCHPALSAATRVALTLRLFGGLSTAEVARALLTSPTAMQRRITRGKRKIAATAMPFRVPAAAELPGRLSSVLAVVALVHSTGTDAPPGDRDGDGLRREAVRLARLLVELMPDEEEAAGLLALLLLTDARRPGRFDETGAVVLLADQDRSSWDDDLVREGHRLVRWCLDRDRPGPFQLQAAIAAVHCDAATIEDTAWTQVLALYDQLLAMTSSPVVALNRAVVVSEVEGPASALGLVEELAATLADYAPYHAVRGALLRRLGDDAAATAAYAEAASLEGPPALGPYLAAQASAAAPR